jgi:SAM-dependent methyltransferase
MHEGVEQSAYLRTRFTPDARRAALWRRLTPYLEGFIPPDGSVLELGAGYCHFINNVHAPRRVAIDRVPELLQWAAPGVDARVLDVLDYLATVPPAEFDFIFASNFLEHFEWPTLEVMIELIKRALSPRGRLGLIQPNFRLALGRYFDDYTHRTIFTDTSLADWLESKSFHVIKIEPRFLPLTVKSGMGRMSALVPLYLRLPWRPFAGQMFVLADRLPKASSQQQP